MNNYFKLFIAAILFLITVNAAAAAWYDDETSLLAYYPFSDGSGSTITDYANSYDMSAPNSITWSTNFPAYATNGNGSAYSGDFLDSITQYASAAIPISTAGHTISLWSKIDSIDSIDRLFGYGSNIDNRFIVQNGGSSQLRIYFKSSGTVRLDTVTSYNWVLDDWVHLVFLLDNSRVVVYANNSVVVNESVAYGLDDVSGTLSIATGVLGGQNLNGQFDDLMVFNKTLNTTEISNLYNYGNIGATNETPPATPTDTTISISYPSNYTIQQLSNLTHGDLLVRGSYTGTISQFQARFNGGSWVNVTTDTTATTFQLNLTGQPLGQGYLEVRDFNVSNGGYDNVSAGLGDVYGIIGSSQIFNCYDYDEETGHTYYSNVYSQGDVWEGTGGALIDDNFLTTTGWSNSCIPQLINYFQNSTYERPLGFITVGHSGSEVQDWQLGGAYYNDFLTSVNIATNGTNKLKGVLTGFGLADMSSGSVAVVSEAYGNLTAIADNLRNDLEIIEEVAMLVHLPSRSTGVTYTSINNVIEAWLQAGVYEVDNDLKTVVFTYDFSLTTDGVHILEKANANDFMRRWTGAIINEYYDTETFIYPHFKSAIIQPNQTINLQINTSLTPLLQEGTLAGFRAYDGSTTRTTLTTSYASDNLLEITFSDSIDNNYNLSLGYSIDAVGDNIAYENESGYYLPIAPFLSQSMSTITETNFSIYAVDSWIASTINTFNATVGGTFYSTTTGTIITTILSTNTTPFNITVQSTGYVSKDYLNYDVSNTLTAELDKSFNTNITFRTENNSLITQELNISIISSNISNNYRTTVGYLNVSGLTVDSYELRIASDEYNDRKYFFNITSEASRNITVYLFLNSSTELQVFSITDTSDEEVSGAILRIYKETPFGTSLWTNYAEEISNAQGKVNTYLEKGINEYYRFSVLIDGEIKTLYPSLNYVTSKTNFIAGVEETIELVIILSDTTFNDYYNTNYGVAYEVEKSGNTIWFDYSDGANTISGAKIVIEGKYNDNSTFYEEISTVSSNSIADNLSYTFTPLNNTIYTVSAYLVYGSYEQLLTSEIISYEGEPNVDKDYGLLYAAIILTVTALLSIYFGVLLSAVLTFSMLIFTNLVGFTSFPTTVITSIIALAIILLMRITKNDEG